MVSSLIMIDTPRQKQAMPSLQDLRHVHGSSSGARPIIDGQSGLNCHVKKSSPFKSIEAIPFLPPLKQFLNRVLLPRFGNGAVAKLRAKRTREDVS